MKINNPQMNISDVGIGLTAYNRPHHLSKTLEGLKLNKVKKVYIFCDGPKSNLDESNNKKISEARDIAEQIDWCEKKIIYREKNLGLKQNTFLSMDYMFNNYEKVIFLDDDCYSNKNFINFLSFCLEKYKNFDQIKSVTGYCPDIEIPKEYNYDIFFSYRHCPWGFASWRRCWVEYKNTKFDHLEIINSKKNKKTLKKLGNDILPMVVNDYLGLSDSIGITWAWYTAKYKGININPKKSLIKNIGHDGSGRHSTKFKKFDVKVFDDYLPNNFSYDIVINNKLNQSINNFHKVSLVTYSIYSKLPLKILKLIIIFYFKFKKSLKK